MSFVPNNTRSQIFGSKVLGAIHDDDASIFNNLQRAIMKKVTDPKSSKKAEFLMKIITHAFGGLDKQFKLKGSTAGDKEKWIKNMAKAQFFITKLKKSIDSKINKSDYNYVKAKNIINKIENTIKHNLSSKDNTDIQKYLSQLDIHNLLGELKID